MKTTKTKEEITDKGKAITEMRMTLGHLSSIRISMIDNGWNEVPNPLSRIIERYSSDILIQCNKILDND